MSALDHLDEPPRVLVVDDRPDNLLALEAILSAVRCEVVAARSGEDALRHLLTSDVALVLLDVQMPGLDGYQTAAAIKARPRTRHVPIIFLSAIDRDIEHQLRAYGAGAVDFLPKPFAPEVLVSKVGTFVELWAQAQVIERQRRQLESQLAELDHTRGELSEQAAELLRANAELERFAMMASQQLEEPLHVAAGFLDLYDGSDPAEDAAAVEAARRGVARAIAIVEGLVQYAGASTDRLDLRPVDLAAELELARGELADALDEVRASVTADPLPTVVGDAWQLRQVFVELLDNALRCRRPGGLEVHVAVSRRNSHWVITVHDDGVGLPADDRERAFGLFVRLGERPDSPGLGLALCRRVVERHGGTMWAADRAEGGTSISFTLPVAGADPA